MLKFSKKQLEMLDVTPVCANCEYASPLLAPGDLLCRLNGVVDEGHTCKKFRYDLLKHKPTAKTSLSDREPLPTLDDTDQEEQESVSE